MAMRQIITMDSSGRVVIPKALRDELAMIPGQPLRAQVRDGRLEIEPEPLDVALVERDGLQVIVPRGALAPLTRDEVRNIIESVRR